MTRHDLAWTLVAAFVAALAPSPNLAAQIVQKATYVDEGSFDVPDQLSRAPERLQAIAWSPADGSVHIAGESDGIFVYDSTGTFARRYGQPELRRTVALVLDSDGRAYALDRERKQVWTFDPDGEALRAIGGRGGDLESLDDPVDLELGPSGYVYVADKGRGGVQVYSRDGVFVRRVRFGEALQKPRGLAVARDGTIYLTDEDATGHIVVYDPFTEGSWAGSAAGPAGQLSFRGARMDDPERVAVTRFGRVLVLDREEGRIWTRNPATRETVGANDLLYGGPGSGRGSFREAVDIALVGDDAVLILDREVRKVEKVRIAFEEDVNELPQLGYPFRVTRGPEVLPVRIRGIRHVEGENPLFVLRTGERAARVVPGRARRFTTVYGDDARAFAPDPDAEGQLFSQSLRQVGWASLNDSLLAVTDPDEDRFALFSRADGSLLGTFGDNYEDQRELDDPRGIALLDDGRVVIADKGNDRLVVFSPDLASLLGVYPLPSADRVVVSPDGNLVAWDEEGRHVLRVAADGSDRQRVSPALLPEQVAGVAFDHLGNLFAVDRESGRVTVLDPTLQRVLIRMGTGGRIREPGGVYTDREGNVYVTDRRDSGQTLVLQWHVHSPVLAGLTFEHGDEAGFRWEPGPADFIRSYQVQASGSPNGPFEVLASTDEPRFLLADAGTSVEEAISEGRARYLRVAPMIANGQVGEATEPLPFVDYTAVYAYERESWDRAMEDAAEAVELVRAGDLDVPDDLREFLPWIAFEAAYRAGEPGRAVEWIDEIRPDAIERHSLESSYHELVPRAYEQAGEHQRALDAARQALDRIEDGSLDLGEEIRRKLMWVAFNSAFQRRNYRAAVGWGERLRPSVTSSRRVEFFSRLPRAQLLLGAPDSAALSLMAIGGQDPRAEYYQDSAVVALSFEIYRELQSMQRPPAWSLSGQAPEGGLATQGAGKTESAEGAGGESPGLQFLREYMRSIPGSSQGLRGAYQDSLGVFETRTELEDVLAAWQIADYVAVLRALQGLLESDDLTAETRVVGRQLLAAALFTFGRQEDAAEAFRQILEIEPELNLEEESQRVERLYGVQIFNPDMSEFFQDLLPQRTGPEAAGAPSPRSPPSRAPPPRSSPSGE